MLYVEMLPVDRGDCLWIEYGTPPHIHRVLIDGGPASTYPALKKRLEERLGPLPVEKRYFDLMIISHIDIDHIGGILELLLNNSLGITFKDIWFNGWKHLPLDAGGVLGPVQGEQLSALLVHQNLPWNKAFEGGPAAISDSYDLPRLRLAGGLELTLLSPTLQALRKLRTTWKANVEEAGLVAGSPEAALAQLRQKRPSAPGVLGPPEALVPDRLAQQLFRGDTSHANASSIAVLLEYEGRRCLLAGDAFSSTLEQAIRYIKREYGSDQLFVDAIKLSHHGGRANTSQNFLQHLHCPRYLVSTNGNIFKHPHRETIARILVYGGAQLSLFFNYRSPFNEIWDNHTLRAKYHYQVFFPSNDMDGLSIQL